MTEFFMTENLKYKKKEIKKELKRRRSWKAYQRRRLYCCALDREDRDLTLPSRSLTCTRHPGIQIRKGFRTELFLRHPLRAIENIDRVMFSIYIALILVLLTH